MLECCTQQQWLQGSIQCTLTNILQQHLHTPTVAAKPALQSDLTYPTRRVHANWAPCKFVDLCLQTVCCIG
jgi:hypothetical protein